MQTMGCSWFATCGSEIDRLRCCFMINRICDLYCKRPKRETRTGPDILHQDENLLLEDPCSP